MNMKIDEVFNAVITERSRQYALKMGGRFRQTVNEMLDDNEKLSVLAEEFGEVAKEVCEINHGNVHDCENLKAELVQVMAVCCAWLEGMN
jgi:hypothetical protein